ncbi:hypothetical protein BT69DRAFT_345679 [Atractiella rhizophila]|nr:hypothetical protein BT69DRAFT_345679 [Atractiella rhizophila]
MSAPSSVSRPLPTSRIPIPSPLPASKSSVSFFSSQNTRKRPTPLEFDEDRIALGGPSVGPSKRLRHSMSTPTAGLGIGGLGTVGSAASRWGVNLRSVAGTVGGSGGGFGGRKEVSFSFDKENLGHAVGGEGELEELKKRLRSMEDQVWAAREEQKKGTEEVERVREENKRLQNLIGVSSYASTTPAAKPGVKQSPTVLSQTKRTPQHSLKVDNRDITAIPQVQALMRAFRELYCQSMRQQTQIAGLELRLMSSKMYGRRILAEFNSRKAEEKGVEEDWEMEVAALEREVRMKDEERRMTELSSERNADSLEVLQVRLPRSLQDKIRME